MLRKMLKVVRLTTFVPQRHFCRLEPPQPNPPEEENSRRSYAIFIFCGASLLAIFLTQLLQKERAETFKKQMKKPRAFGEAAIGARWQLTDTQGNTHSSADLDGRYYIIYFGFCRCPDICPQSLSKLAAALRSVRGRGTAPFKDLQMVFVSVDPDRDSPERIRHFTELFDSSIIGVTGTSNDDAALRKMLKDFRIYSSKIEFSSQEGEKDYTLDHSVLAYLMSHDNKYLTHLGGSLAASELEETIVETIQEYEEHRKFQAFKLAPNQR